MAIEQIVEQASNYIGLTIIPALYLIKKAVDLVRDVLSSVHDLKREMFARSWRKGRALLARCCPVFALLALVIAALVLWLIASWHEIAGYE